MKQLIICYSIYFVASVVNLFYLANEIARLKSELKKCRGVDLEVEQKCTGYTVINYDSVLWCDGTKRKYNWHIIKRKRI